MPIGNDLVLITVDIVAVNRIRAVGLNAPVLHFRLTRIDNAAAGAGKSRNAKRSFIIAHADDGRSRLFDRRLDQLLEFRNINFHVIAFVMDLVIEDAIAAREKKGRQ